MEGVDGVEIFFLDFFRDFVLVPVYQDVAGVRVGGVETVAEDLPVRVRIHIL